MARDSFDESKTKKKKTTKAATKPKSQSSSVSKPKATKVTSSVNKKASKSTFLGGGVSTQKVKKAVTNNKPKTVKKQPTQQERINQKTYGTTTAPTRRTKTTTTNTQRNVETKVRQTVEQARRTRTEAQQQKLTGGVDAARARRQTREIGNEIRRSVTDSLSEDNRAFAQRQKSGILTEADKKIVEQRNQRRAQIAKNTGAVAWKAAQDTVSGYGQSLADVDEMVKSNKNWTKAKAQKMGIDLNDKAKVSKVEQERQQSIKEAREFRQELFNKQEKRQAEWDERTKNAKGLEKAWYGAVESGTGMLADTAVGAVTGTGQFGALASMGLRTYGPSTMQARKEGATDKEARLYGAAQSVKEMGTELMFQGAGLAKAAYGKTGLSLADKSANVLTRGLTGLKADAVGAGVRALGGTAEENVEELAGWMADPLIKELTYGKAVRNRMKENLRSNIPQIGSGADAANVASYFSTPKFTNDLTKEYVKSGMSKDKAAALAAEMRDYYVAYYSGDKGKTDALEEDLAAKLSGQDKLSFKSWSMDELKDTLASTTLLTLATGLPGAVNSSVKGNRIFDSDEVKAVFGNDAVKKVADAVKNTSNKEMSLKADVMKQRLDSGKDLTGTQKFDLYQGYIEKVNETSKKARASYGVVENAREEQDLVPTMGVDRAGNTVYAKETQREYDEKYASTAVTAESLRRFMESDNSISDDEIRRTDAAIKAVSDLHVGGLTIGDAHEFAYGNTLARETLKAEEGIDLDRYIVRDANGNVDLAATNEATENALFKINADNAIKAAQAETEVYIDDTRGNIDKDLLTRFGNSGQAAWKEVNKDLDPRDLKNYLTTANAASYFYSAGRNTDMSVDEAINRYADTFKTVDNTVLEKAFAAGAEDRIIANTPGYGQTVEAGSNIQLKKTEPVVTGQLIMDDDVVLPDSDQSAYLALAMSTNTNIHIVSNLNAMGKDGKPIINQATGLPVQLNGMSHGNDIYLNMNEASEKNLGYVFMHEMTHQIKQYAPNEYLALENLVRDKWFNKDATGMQAAIKQRMDLYSVKGGQQLTEEEAVEEIIADAMAEAMDDPNFAAEVCEQDINLGQQILDSIRAALRSIRQIFANSDVKNDRFHNSLLSYLGILDEAEKMWLNALATAKQNKADGLIADWQDKANKQNSPRLSVTEVSDEELERIKAKKRTNKRDREILRDAGEKLKENDFYNLYTAHIINLGGKGKNADQMVESIKKNGFKGSGGFGVNLVDSSINNIRRQTEEEIRADFAQYGIPEDRIEEKINQLKETTSGPNRWIDGAYYEGINATVDRYGGRKGQTVMFVPEHHTTDDRSLVETGFKPFDYEVVNVERDFQPYYELYSKAYDEAHESRYSITPQQDADINELDKTNSIVEDENGDPVAQFEDNGSVSFSISSYEAEGRKIYKDYLDKLVNDKELSQKEADDMLRELETIYNISKRFADSGRFEPYTAWSYADVVRDAKGKPVFSSIRKNSEYKMNIDFSTICKKRRTLDAVFREMIRRGMFEKLDLNKDESAAMVVNINNLIRKNKFEAACALCFVEARRYRQQQTAKTFTNMWNELVESMYSDKDKIAYFNFGRDEQVQDVPDGIHTMDDSQLDLSHVRAVAEELNDKGKPKQTAEAKAARLILNNPEQRKLMRVGDMMASTGFENMHVENPELEKVYNSKKGTGGAKSSFGDVQYLNEIINSKTFDRQKAYDVSGVRIQSFSDYVPRMVFDYVQVIADLAAKKLPAHAYTKEVLFVLQFGLTGAKVNMSLVPDVVADGIAPGLDKDGNYAWNAEGTFPWEDYTDEKGRKWPGARSIQKAKGYKENCGTIAVGISDKQIMKMLADPEIQMVIPYHKSSLNPIVAAMTNVDRFTNYEDFQNTKNAEGKAVKTDFAWDKKLFGLTHYTRGEKKGELKPRDKWGDVQGLVKEYVDWCESKNYTPKFSQFLYLKENNDPDGDFVLDENGNKIINPGYYKMLEDFALMDNDGNFKPQGDVHMQFPTAETGIDGMSMESLIERGLTDDTELEAMRSEKIGGIVDEIDNMFNEGTLTEQSVASQKLAQKFSISPEMDDAYMDAVNSGNMDEAQRLVEDAAKMAGFDTPLYHGTDTFGFTTIDNEAPGADGFSFWAASREDASATYTLYGKRRNISDGALSEDEQESMLDEVSSEIDTAIDEFRDLIDRTFSEWVFGQSDNSYLRSLVDEANPQPGNGDGVYDVLSEIIFDAYHDYGMDSEMEYDEWSEESEEGQALWDAVNNIEALRGKLADIENGEIKGGVYGLYANTNNLYELDAEGKAWNELRPEGLPELPGYTGVGTRPYRTRDVANWARENGYDGVRFKNIKDNGAYGRTAPFDVYAFFKPQEQVKSADTVTYAEDGSVIPLSERFDPTNNDIRYSMPTQDSDGKILTDGQMEYFKNSQARDEQGRLLVLYHYSNALFESFDPDLLGTTSGDRYPNTAYGFFVTDDKDFSQQFGENEYKLYANFKNPIIHPYGASYKYSEEECEDITRRWLEVIDPEQFDYYEELREDDPDLTLYDYYMDLTSPGESPFEYADFERSTLEEAGFDAVEIVEGIRDGVEKPTTSYALFKREDVKLVDNPDPTNVPELRYSIATRDEVSGYLMQNAENITDIPLQDARLEENRIRYSLDATNFENNIIASWDRRKRNLAEEVQETPLKNELIRLMKQVRKGSGTDRKYSTETIEETIRSIKKMYYFAKGDKAKEYAREAWDAAERIVDDIDYNDELYKQYQGITDYFASYRINLSEDIYDAFGNYKNDEVKEDFEKFVKDNSGKIRFSWDRFSDASDIVELHYAYSKLSEEYPDLFPSDIDNPIDMLLQMDYVLNLTDPYRDAYTSEEHSKLVEDIANSLCNIVDEGNEYKATVDDLNVKAMKQRHREAILKVKEIEKQKRDNQIRRAELWKARYNERIKQDKADKEAGKQKQNEKKLVGDIEKNIKWLSDRLRPETRSKDNAIPEQFRSALAGLLAEFDIQSKGSKKIEKKKGYPSKTTLKLKQLRDQYAAIAKENDDDGNNVFRYNGDLLVKMDELIKAMEGLDKFFDKRYGREVTIADLSLSEMLIIDTMLKSLVHQFREYKNVTIESKRAEIAGVSSEVIGDMDTQVNRHGAAREGGALGKVNGLLNMAEVTPIYFFKRLGAMYKMYRELRRGFDKYIENDREVIKRLSEIMSGYYNKKNPGTTIESWRTMEDAQTFNFEYGPVTLSVAQMMEVYLYANRPQAFGHMIGDGIIVTPISPVGKIAKAKEKLLGHEPMVDPVRLTYENVQEIISKLSEEQVNMANKLQELVAGYMSDLGNETTMKLYGYKMFDDPNYFGIHVSQTATNSSVDAPAITETIKNFGWTKPLTPGAKNTIVIGDIFTDVARYCNEMNQFNAYAVPVSDFMRVYNYKLRDEDGTLKGSAKSAIIKAFGNQAHTYIMNFLRDLNGASMRRNGGLEGMIDSALGRAKKAAVFMNMRVALQQPTAIIRALAQINARYFVGVRPSRKATQEMIEHCPIAQWKAWGFYDTHFGRDVEDLIMNNWSKADVIGSALYGALDNMTWGMIWQAVKKEVEAKQPALDKGSPAYWEACKRRASEVFDSTQVVDSPFHRSDAMRSKDTLVKQFTSFQAEPTLSFNVVRDFVVQAYDAVADGDKSKAVKLIAKGVEIWTLQAAVVAVAQSLWDAVRHKDPDGDDDEDEGFLELWWQNFMADFVDDLKFYNNIYFLKEFTPYAEKLVDYMKTGKWDTYDSNKLLMFQGAEKMTQGLQQLIKKIQKGDEYKHKNGEPYTWYEVMTNFLGGVGYLTGMPIGTVMRDAQSILKWFHINAFAADGTEEKTKPGLMDAIANKMGYRPIDKKGSSEIKEKDSFLAQLGIGKTEEEKEQDAFEKKTKDIADKYADLSGEEKDKKVWSSVTTYLKEQNEDKGVADMVTNGDYATINKYRQMYLSAGGNAEYFDNRVLAESKKALKKSIKYDQTNAEIDAQNRIKSYMMDHGVTEQEISEIAYKSATAKDMKIAFIINDKDAMLESLEPLVYAGLTYEDLERIWENRNRIDIMKYKSSNGRYADRLKSTGKFIWPTDGVITSHFGYRNAPTRGASSNHPAIDIGAPQGTAVVAADGGVVISAGANGGYGNSVGIKHDNGMITWYNHLYGWNVKVGDTVAQGQQIAQVGSTGISTGPHLDFKIMDTDGNPVDPEKYLEAR